MRRECPGHLLRRTSLTTKLQKDLKDVKDVALVVDGSAATQSPLYKDQRRTHSNYHSNILHFLHFLLY
jgi:hypothetical protein